MIVKELAARLGLEVDSASFAAGNAAISNVRGSLLTLTRGLAVGLSAVATAALGAVKTTADAGDEMRKLAQRTGIDSKALQEFAYAGRLANLTTEDLARAMNFLARSGVKDVRAETLRLADQLAAMPDGAEKTRIAMKAFGRETGARMIPLLNAGSKGLAAMAAEAQALGIIFSEEDQKASEDFNDELTRLGQAFVGIRNTIGLALIRPLTALAMKMREVILAMRALPLQDLVQGLKFLAIAIGAVTLASWLMGSGFAAAGLAAVVAAAKAVVAWLAAAAPFVLIAAGIAIVLLLLEDLYQFLTGGESVIGHFVDYVKTEFGSWGAFFKALLDWVLYLFGLLWENIKKGVAPAVDWLKGIFSEFWTWLTDGFKAVGAAIGSHLKDAAKIALATIPGGSLIAGAVTASDSLSGFFGGGATPAAAAASSVSATAPVVQAPQFSSEITINAAPGMSAQEIANQVSGANDEWWNSKMREAAAGVE